MASIALPLLDLYCGAGGAARGYADAGFTVVGVDKDPQPHYPFKFIQCDALEYLSESEGMLAELFCAIHASPPCQHWTAYNRRPHHVGEHPQLIEPTREHLERSGLPYVIENVPGAPLRDPVQFCGSSLGLDVRRHRRFESNVELVGSPCVHELQTPRFPPATNRTNLRSTVEIGVWRIPLETQRKAMGIDWMTLPELSQAIPPAYTQHIGWQLRGHIERERAQNCADVRCREMGECLAGQDDSDLIFPLPEQCPQCGQDEPGPLHDEEAHG